LFFIFLNTLNNMNSHSWFKKVKPQIFEAGGSTYTEAQFLCTTVRARNSLVRAKDLHAAVYRAGTDMMVGAPGVV
jgi:hypothetical protein